MVAVNTLNERVWGKSFSSNGNQGKSSYNLRFFPGVVDVDIIQPDLDSLPSTPNKSNGNIVNLPRGPHIMNNNHLLPSNKRPDSLAVKGHDYEELPNQR